MIYNMFPTTVIIVWLLPQNWSDYPTLFDKYVVSFMKLK